MKNFCEKPFLLSFSLLLMLVFTQLPCGAAADMTKNALDISGAVAVALANNPKIQAGLQEVAAATSQVVQARSGFFPQVDISETYNRTTSPLWAFGTKLNQSRISAADFVPNRLNDPDAIDNFKTALSLSWRLYDGGQTWIGWHQSKDNQRAGELALARVRQEVIGQTAMAYVGCLLAYENRNVIEQALKTAGAHLKVIEDRERTGMAVKSDVLRAQVRIGELTQEKLQAESAIQVALAGLGSVMGTPQAVDRVTELSGVFENCIPVQGSLETWIADALANRPDLKQIAVQEMMATRQVDRAKAAHYPQVALQGNYELNGEQLSDSEDNYTIGAMVSVNLYSGQRISAQCAEARALLAKIQALRKGMELKVRMDTRKAFYTAQSSWQSIAVAQTAVDQAGEGLRIVANRYENGLLALISLLDAQVAYQQAQTRHFKAMHDYKVARIALAMAGGVIDEQFK